MNYVKTTKTTLPNFHRELTMLFLLFNYCTMSIVCLLCHISTLVVEDEQCVAIASEHESVLNGEVVSLHYEVVTAESACLHEEC